MCSPKIGLHHHRDPGLQLEMAGQVRSRRVTAKEEEPGGGRVGCGVSKEWDWGLETGSLLCLGGNPGAPKGAEWILEKDCPELGWGLGSR